MDMNRAEDRARAPRNGLLRRLVFVAALLSIITFGLVGTASAGSFWYYGSRLENSWYSTHPTQYTYSYVYVDVSCGTPCTRFLDSTSSGLVSSSGKLRHWPAGGSATSWLSCKWDTVGSGSYATLECYRS